MLLTGCFLFARRCLSEFGLIRWDCVCRCVYFDYVLSCGASGGGIRLVVFDVAW